jgi:sterol desaturase/sphingolipid hydroxylase (fatty acid hydroxylase superfamily)
MRSAARWLLFPLVVGGGLAAVIVLIEGGTAPALAVAVVELAAFFAVITAERLLPYRPDWNRRQGDLGADVGHALVSGVIGLQLLQTGLRAAGLVGAAWLSRTLGSTLWPTDWPLAGQVGLAFLIAELPQYWLHRLQHEWDGLWRFHAVHHSAPRLYWLNAARFHPLDLWLLYSVGYLPLAVLGCPEVVLALFLMFDGILGIFQHSNVDVRLGPLNWVFSMAEPHRWHHSHVAREANTNYGSNLIVWDLLFGTFFLPRGRLGPASIGIRDLPRFPTRYLPQLAAPFRWGRTKQEAAAPARVGLQAPWK